MQDEVYPAGTKKCLSCAVVKPLSDYYIVNRPGGRVGTKARCIECQRAIGREYFQANKVARNAKRQEWRKANPDKARKWQNANGPFKRLRNDNSRRAKRWGVPWEPVDYEAILERSGGMCEICHEPLSTGRISFDHIIPMSRGGAHRQDNVQVTHLSCNISKGARLPHEVRPTKETRRKRLVTCPNCEHQFSPPKRRKPDESSPGED